MADYQHFFERKVPIMIDFTLDSVHQELQDMYRKFAEERV